jgi:hypothetical protein
MKVLLAAGWVIGIKEGDAGVPPSTKSFPASAFWRFPVRTVARSNYCLFPCTFCAEDEDSTNGA